MAAEKLFMIKTDPKPMSGHKFDFSSRLEHVTGVASERYLRCSFIHTPHYTDHGVQHCKNIEKHFQNFISVNHQLLLNEYEEFLLKCAIWLHDIGMTLRKDETEELSETRKKHHKRSSDMIDSDDGRKIFRFEAFESNAIATISRLHSRQENIHEEIVRYGEDGIVRCTYKDINGESVDFDIDLEKLSMILRLLDACDREYTRAYNTETLLDAKLPEAAMYHWAHSCVTNVKFNDGTIEIHSIVPPPSRGETKSQEEDMIDVLVVNSIGREIDSLDQSLRKYSLSKLNVVQVPNRTGKNPVPQDIYEKYKGYVTSTKFLSVLSPHIGFITRSAQKNVCIFKNGHTIIDLYYDILVTAEEGVKSIRHMFSSDESSASDFRFRSLNAMKAEPIENRWKDSCFMSRLLEHNLDGSLTMNVEEIEGIETPLKAKHLQVVFSEVLKKGSKVKYSIGYSAPGLFDTTTLDKIMKSSLSVYSDMDEVSITLKFERGLIGNDFRLQVLDTYGVEKFTEDLNTQEPTKPIWESDEGIFKYTRESTVYYDVHNLKIEHPKRDRRFVIQWKFMADEGRG